MTSPEVFYLHIHGEQKGPYTIPQIDHLLNSGLIAEETLFWREGLDQWQPVTSLVALRRKANPWMKPLVIVGVLLVLAIAVQFFGSIVLLGWREANQHEYSTAAAYWRARSVVRGGALAPGTLVEFHDVASTKVELQPPHEATVLLRGEVTSSSGQARSVAWSVPMKFDDKAGEWTGGPAREIASSP